MKWQGQTKCEFCEKDVTKENCFFDAKTVLGFWALMCNDCFMVHGVKLGIGWGQKYDSRTLEKLGG